jgi:hypothetical protein
MARKQVTPEKERGLSRGAHTPARDVPRAFVRLRAEPTGQRCTVRCGCGRWAGAGVCRVRPRDDETSPVKVSFSFSFSLFFSVLFSVLFSVFLLNLQISNSNTNSQIKIQKSNIIYL